MRNPLTAFMAPSRIDVRSVMPSYDWARQAAKERLTVVSGFNSRLENDVLHFLLRGQANIIILLARRMYTRIPQTWHKPMQQGRLLIVSISNALRQSQTEAARRNRYAATIATNIVLPSLPPAESSLRTLYDNLLAQGRTVHLLV